MSGNRRFPIAITKAGAFCLPLYVPPAQQHPTRIITGGTEKVNNTSYVNNIL